MKKILKLIFILIIIVITLIIWYKKNFKEYYKNNTVYDYEENWDKYEEIIIRAIYWNLFWNNKWSKEVIKKLERKKEIPVYVWIRKISREEVKLLRNELTLKDETGNFLNVYIDSLKSIITIGKIEGQITDVTIQRIEKEKNQYENYKEIECAPCKIIKIKFKDKYKEVMDEEEKCKNSIVVNKIIKNILKKKNKKLYKKEMNSKGVKELILKIGYFNSKYPKIYYKIEGIDEAIGEVLFNVKTNKLIYNFYKGLLIKGERYIEKVDKYSFEVKIKKYK